MAWLRLVRYKNLIIIVLLQYLLRYQLILPILEYYDVMPALSHLRFALLVLATVCLAASGYAINDYFDIQTDLINRPKKVLVGRTIDRRKALLLHLILTFIGVFTGFFLAYVTRKEIYVVMFLLIPALLWYYSTTFKKQFLVGNLLISILTALVAWVVVSVEFAAMGRQMGEAIIQSAACSTAWFWTTGFAFFAFLSNLMREMIKDMEDVKGDTANGCNTLPIALGVRYTKALVMMLAMFSVAVLWLVFASVPQLRQSALTAVYFSVAITLPYLFLMWQIRKARQPHQFHMASTASKIIMLTGILYIVIAGMFFQ
ncbi:4-hydroxybenzoate polyprenyltransferase [Breznakibacter xylanolyticus]|uniref:4-hydroxybenzoate polyprenyltransferase n=1 Tax=Breznakibacter xylanolyticus TaxID=990 RepID=A0A2W7NBT8_9BACT|nr:geranylgeranylglycerol-phosphate geranylgeranyltransferase [Breznakibacter xylanolyticus]PZX17905.1 4-hydroxybenzoate polyprenyltransferase [Breznakibacter xylanolyticus]